MAIDEAPPFWWKKPRLRAWLLSPLGTVYGRAAAARMALTPSASVEVPVICVGNFILGGAGKTPTVAMIAEYLIRQKINPGILSRGYGGAITNPTLVDLKHHNSRDVGDEALLHARVATTVVAHDRAAGARLLVEHGCKIILMDDGMQNPTLRKDYNLAVIDSNRGIGNGYCIPAGPMRVPLNDQLTHIDAALLIGEGDEGTKTIRKVARAGKPVFQAFIEAKDSRWLKGKKVIAFAGIGDPEKFYQTLREQGCEIEVEQNFGDHHMFTEDECVDLINLGREKKLDLITTEKDHVRLLGMGVAQEKLAEVTKTLPITLVPDDPATLDRIIQAAISRGETRLLAEEKANRREQIR